MESKSHIVVEQEKWLKFDPNGVTKLVGEKQVNQGDSYSYRKVHYTRQDNFQKSFFKTSQNFRDPEFPLTDSNVQNLGIKGTIVLKRLFNLYPQNKNGLPPFFPLEGTPLTKVNNGSDTPSFLSQINLYDPLHYKSLFITQSLQENGLYHILINQDGRFETDVVDDYIPVHEDTQEPIWGMDLEFPWQIILLKFWAKKLRGYDKVRTAKPFDFIQCFSNSNWKYFNVGREGIKFLQKYSKLINNGKYILKTRNDNMVNECGLVSNCAGYQIIKIQQISSQQSKVSQKKWVLTIRSTLKNKWAGQMSVIDERVNSYYKTQHFIRLQRDFLISGEQFLNLFSSVYISAKREKNQYFSNYYILQVPPNSKKAVYLSFLVPQKGFFDFTVKQWEKNKIPNEGKQQYKDRYLKNKYMLVSDSSSNSSNIVSGDYTMKPKYQIYSIQYQKGYNRGDAHFENIDQGKYILKIKPQTIKKTAYFTINYCSNTKFSMNQIQLDRDQTSELMRNSMCSIIQKVPRVSLDKTAKHEQICFGNTFQQIGYGYIAIRSKKSNPYNLLLQVDPKKLNQQGFTLKNQFKRLTEPFAIVIKPGQITSLVLKKPDLSKNFDWPPAAVGIFIQPK